MGLRAVLVLPKMFRSFHQMRKLAAFLPMAASAAGCGGEAPVDYLKSGAIKEGAALPGTSCTINTKDGKAVTPADGIYFLRCPLEISFDQKFASGSSVKKFSLQVWSDASKISFKIPLTDAEKKIDLTGKEIDIDGDGTADISDPNNTGSFLFTMPADAQQYDGMVNIDRMNAAVLSLTPAERKEIGAEGCAEIVEGNKPYLPLYHCPSDKMGRPSAYITGYVLESKDGEVVTGGLIKDEEIGILYEHPEKGTPLGTIEIPYEIPYPQSFYADDIFGGKATVGIVVNARDFDNNAPFEGRIFMGLTEEQ